MADNFNITVDELDLTILSHLYNDGRKSFSDIARELDVAVNTVRNRVNKMANDGIITFITRIAPEKMGFQAYANILIATESDKVDSITEELLTEIELALVKQGYLEKEVEYDMLGLTDAIKLFQKDKNLPFGSFNIPTLEALEIYF